MHPTPESGDEQERDTLSGTELAALDSELLAAHVAGDPGAFGLLVSRHQSRLWAVALRTMGDPEEASDALQDALISAFRRAETFRGDSAVTTWLHRIVINACLDRHRRRAVRPTVPLPDDDVDIERAVVDPVDHMDRWETSTLVQHALSQLPPAQRAAIILVDLEGYSVEEAALALGCAEGTIKSRCARGRTKLAGLLSGLRESNAPPRNQVPTPHVRPGSSNREGGGG